MFTLKHKIDFNKLYFIFASHNNRLGSKNQVENNGMCWKCPGELKTFKQITTNYKNTSGINSLIVGKTTAKLLPLDKMNDRDIYILDFCKDVVCDEYDSILYKVKSHNDIIEDLNSNSIKDSGLEWGYLDNILEDLTLNDGNVFIIGGASVYKYFLDRFPLMCGFISIINNKNIPWIGSESDILYSPINTLGDSQYYFDTYISNNNFQCVRVVPNAYKIRETYNKIKNRCILNSYLRVQGDEIQINYDDCDAVFEISFSSNNHSLYVGENMKSYVDLFIFHHDKTFILEEWITYDLESNDSYGKTYYVLYGEEYDEILILLER